MVKIGLAGCYGNGKTILSLVLSETTGLPRAHVENMDVLYREIYKKDKDPKDLDTSELLCMGLARFHSRVKQEAQGGFISDGTALNEIAYGKARMKMQGMLSGRKANLKNRLLGKKYMGFSERLERTIVDYAKQNYDMVYYLKTMPKNKPLNDRSTEFQELFDKYFLEILTENKIGHKVLKGNIESSAREILSDLKRIVPQREELMHIISEKEKLKNGFPKEFQFGRA